MSHWTDHYREFPEGQSCIYNGPQCTGTASQGDHNLHKRNESKKAKQTGLTYHLCSIINFGPACANCNAGDKFCDTQEGKRVGLEWAVEYWGIERIAVWADEFPEEHKFPGSEWEEMMNRLVKYNSGKEV